MLAPFTSPVVDPQPMPRRCPRPGIASAWAGCQEGFQSRGVAEKQWKWELRLSNFHRPLSNRVGNDRKNPSTEGCRTIGGGFNPRISKPKRNQNNPPGVEESAERFIASPHYQEGSPAAPLPHPSRFSRRIGILRYVVSTHANSRPVLIRVFSQAQSRGSSLWAARKRRQSWVMRL